MSSSSHDRKGLRLSIPLMDESFDTLFLKDCNIIIDALGDNEALSFVYDEGSPDFGCDEVPRLEDSSMRKYFRKAQRSDRTYDTHALLDCFVPDHYYRGHLLRVGEVIIRLTAWAPYMGSFPTIITNDSPRRHIIGRQQMIGIMLYESENCVDTAVRLKATTAFTDLLKRVRDYRYTHSRFLVKLGKIDELKEKAAAAAQSKRESIKRKRETSRETCDDIRNWVFNMNFTVEHNLTDVEEDLDGLVDISAHVRKVRKAIRYYQKSINQLCNHVIESNNQSE